MPRASKTTEVADLVSLTKGIVDDCEKLIAEHFELLRTEVRQELNHAKSAALRVGSGAGLIASGGVLTTFMAVHLLHKTTRLPLWGCYGLVAGTLGAAGVQLLASGRAEASQVQVPALPHTLGALQEDAAWLKDSMSIQT